MKSENKDLSGDRKNDLIDKKKTSSKLKSEELDEKKNKTSEAHDKIVKLEEENKALKDQLLRLYADFENLKKRTQKDLSESHTRSIVSFCKKIIPVVDNFERALLLEDDKENDVKKFKGGLKLIYDGLLDTLNKEEVKAIDVKKGDIVDTNFHEVVAQVGSDEKLRGKIIEVVSKGYILNDKIIRYSQVVVGK